MIGAPTASDSSANTAGASKWKWPWSKSSNKTESAASTLDKEQEGGFPTVTGTEDPAQKILGDFKPESHDTDPTSHK